ncbi:HAMP domain-containing protein [Sulfitobacter mediterraneus]|uniref:sensor histidine kinase n=2 Tax=Sulfitobacter mediterraneus TaxID=83219 RepID=UPI0019325DDC|nr:ATP-binding protein [Sulfitobacter mediterraneus]MBM1641774.1 HAMP domain-containing protein [Sulfitobacter mediterraneus]MBM1645575.1 HAMP domain-containing protein [Sulfitobacter mediterraneus]MBM1653644.1 HAMP domain-containing protein [Sulfitobacter mediterraneus]MBM1657988.1 HAMP domain-containing protein [Sulfitobacter mediterraneus]MBM1665807.1 HAMP domain-containing protein [Sulfitobacter mediterraneus]
MVQSGSRLSGSTKAYLPGVKNALMGMTYARGMLPLQWLGLPGPNHLSRITVRLRIALLILATVTAVVWLASMQQARAIMQSYNQLDQAALPILDRSEGIQAGLVQLAALVSRIDRIQANEATDHIRDDIAQSVQDMHKNLGQLIALGQSQVAISELTENLRLAEASALSILEDRISYLKVRQTLNSQHKILNDLHTQSQDLLEKFTLNLSSQTNDFLQSMSLSGQISPAMVADAFEGLFLPSLTVTSLSFELDRVVGLAHVSNDSNVHQEHARALAQAQLGLQRAILYLAELPEGPDRLALSRHIAGMRDVLREKDGIFTQKKALATLDEAQRKHRETQQDLTASAMQLTSGLVIRSRDVVEAASQALQQAISRITLTLVIAVAVGLTVTFTANHSIIERQFNRRIHRLNQSVRAIASGDLNHPIPVSGPDELGEMANALLTFKKNAEDLHYSNEELEKFAYITAHDLRTPVRAIQDLCTWVSEDEENQLSSESRAYLSLLEKRTLRLNGHLNDLLAYVQAEHVSDAFELVDFRQTVIRILKNLDPDQNFEVVFGKLPMPFGAKGDVLRNICTNLLINVIKHHDRPNGRITFQAEIIADQYRFEIQDDGPGISPLYHEKVFELFQTLKPRDEVEGSGLGLAVVRKLIKREKGAITLQSNPDLRRGTTICVTLPLHPPPARCDQTRLGKAA